MRRYRVYFSDWDRGFKTVEVEAEGYDDAAERAPDEYQRRYPHVVVSPGRPCRVEEIDLISDVSRIKDAYGTLSQAINGGRNRKHVEDAIGGEHSTLLGQLANIVMGAVRERPSDGRLCDLNARLDEKAKQFALVSDVRQAFI